MSKMFFDTLHYSKRLQDFGYSEEQADGHATLIGELVETKLATKDDLKAVELCLKEDMKKMENVIRDKRISKENRINELLKGIYGDSTYPRQWRREPDPVYD